MDLNKLFDYTDNFTEIVRTTRPISAEELTVRFFCAPQWIIALMKFRNAIVKPFGLKGEKNLSDLVIVESDSLATTNTSILSRYTCQENGLKNVPDFYRMPTKRNSVKNRTIFLPFSSFSI